MSGEGRRIDPDYVRLSGEIADDAILAALRALYPRARIEHAYASTEAGVVFAVDDGNAGFPASWLESDGAVADEGRRRRPVRPLGPLRAALSRRRTRRRWPMRTASSTPATWSSGAATGSIFVGRRGGIINVGGAKVHPEEVEAALNAHAGGAREPRVRAQEPDHRRARRRRRRAARRALWRDAGSEREILAACRARLPPHMVPAGLRFVAELPMTDGGKLARHG